MSAMSIVSDVRAIILSAKPANQDCPSCRGALRPASEESIQQLLRALRRIPVIGRVPRAA